MTRSTTKMRGEIEDLVCEHSLIYSRGSMGFTGLTDEERAMMKPVRQRLVRTHPVTGRKSLYLSSHAGAIVGWPVPEARDSPARSRSSTRRSARTSTSIAGVSTIS